MGAPFCNRESGYNCDYQTNDRCFHPDGLKGCKEAVITDAYCEMGIEVNDGMEDVGDK